MTNDDEQLRATISSLERVQQFDPETLARQSSLGDDFNFKPAVEPASNAIRLFQQLPVDVLPTFPKGHLTRVKQSADSFFNVLSQLLKFSPKQANPAETHQGLLNQVRDQHEQVFNQIHDLISYGASRHADVASLQRDFRAAIQGVEDRAAEITLALTKDQDEASRILADIRKVAAEHGVSQQSYYFSEESKSHETEARIWRKLTFGTAAALAAYAVLSLFVHKLEILTPKDTYETVQLTVSKVLIFAVIGYMLILFAKNYLAHKHNSIVNKHRQNALLTFQALVDAAGTEERRDVIVSYAAACIFSPQDTGYTKSGSASQPELPVNIIQAIPKLTGSAP